MRCMIIGATGYVGSRLREEVERKLGYEVIPWGKQLLTSPRTLDSLDRERLDWLDPKLHADNFRTFGTIEAIVHLGFPDATSLQGAEDNSVIERVERGIDLLVDLASQYHARTFLHMSTVKVYGRGLAGTVNEDTALRPGDLYSRLHYAAEKRLAEISGANEIRSVSFRLTNAFGPPSNKNTKRWDLIVNEMCKTAVVDGSILLGSGARSERDFIPMTVVLSRLGRELAKIEDRQSVGAGWRAVNLSTGYSRSIESIAALVAEQTKELTGREVKILKMPVSPVPLAPVRPVPLSVRSRYYPMAPAAEADVQIRDEIDSTIRSCLRWFLSE